MQSINVVRTCQFGSEPASIEAVFVRFGEQPHWYAASQRSEKRITDAGIREAIHSQVDLLCFLINLRNRPHPVIL